MNALTHLASLLLGAVVALAAVAVHRLAVGGLPLGLALAVVASVATAWELRRGEVPRGAATYVAGWVVVTGGTLAGRPEGDFAVASDVPGYTLIVTGLVLVVLGVASLASGGANLDSAA